MANVKGLPQESLEAVARQIGRRLFASLDARGAAAPETFEGEDEDPAAVLTPFDPAELAAASFELCETFEVWRLGAGAVEDFLQTDYNLSAFARPTGSWHHQIKASVGERRAVVAYARSWPMGVAGGDWSVRDVFFSPLAAALDEAVARADAWADDAGVGDDAEARLLSLTEYKVEALWFVSSAAGAAGEEGAPSRVMIVSAPPDFKGPAPLTFVDSREFLRALVDIRKGMGLRL